MRLTAQTVLPRVHNLLSIDRGHPMTTRSRDLASRQLLQGLRPWSGHSDAPQ